MIHNERELVAAGARMAKPKHRFSVATPAERIAELDALAKKLGINRNALMNLAMNDLIKKYQRAGAL